jgi:hydroxymethylpyrimidine/phosphomethylpyrimidine kinase
MERPSIPIALTVAGSDPSGGAGLQADLKTFHQHRVYGASVVTLLTVQSTTSVSRVEVMRPELVDQQLAAVLADFTPDAVKTGALGNAAIIEVVAARLAGLRVVVDPVMVSKHGHALLGDDGKKAVLEQLVPRAFLLTPNAHEAEVMLGRPVRTLAQARDAARALQQLGAVNVLLKGGHLEEPDAVDVLAMGATLREFHAPRIASPHTHGTGCTLASAVTAWLARGVALEAAVTHARAFISRAIATAPLIGKGIGPVNHFAEVE